MGRFRNKHICQGWKLSQFSGYHKSYWLTVPPGSDLLAIGDVLSTLPGGCGKMITNDIFEATEIYFRTDLRFNDVYRVIIARLGLENKQKPKPRRPHKRKRKPVLQYSLTGELIKEWASLYEAAIGTGVNAGNISLSCRTENKKAGGYYWKYKNN